jgi:hypothetical protein
MSGVFRNIDPRPFTARRVREEDTLAGWRRAGGSIVRKTQDTALYSLYICKYFVVSEIGQSSDRKKSEMCFIRFNFCVPRPIPRICRK